MGVPSFLLRKLYRRGSLRELPSGGFSFVLQNPLGSATIIAPPRFVVNGVAFDPDQVDAGELELASISEDEPFVFAKGTEVALRFPGWLLRGGNRIHINVETTEFGSLDFLVEDREAKIKPSTDEEE